MIKRFFGFLLLVGLFSADSVLSVTNKRVLEHAPLFSKWLDSFNIPFSMFSIFKSSLEDGLRPKVLSSRDHRSVEIYYCDAETFIDDTFLQAHFLGGGGSSSTPPFKLLFVYGWDTCLGSKSAYEKKALWEERRRKVASTYTVFVYYLSSGLLEDVHTETVRKECLNKNVSNHEGLGSPAHAAPRLDGAMFPFGASAGLGLPPVGASPAEHVREEMEAVAGGSSCLSPRVGDKRGLDAPSILARPLAIQAPPELVLAAAKRVRVINLSDDVVDLITPAPAPVADYVDLVTPVAPGVAADLLALGAGAGSAAESSSVGAVGGGSSGNRVRRQIDTESYLSYEFSPVIKVENAKIRQEDDLLNHKFFKKSVSKALKPVYNNAMPAVTLVGVTDETITEDLAGLVAAGIHGILKPESFSALSDALGAQGQSIIFDNISSRSELRKPCPGLVELYASLLPLPEGVLREVAV